MFKIFKKKKQFKKIKKIFKSADELFSSGKIFNAKNNELNDILKKILTRHTPSQTTKYHDIIRTMTILSIKNNRGINKIQIFNIVLLVFLSILTINLAQKQLKLTEKQTHYTEISTRNERINQALSKREALEYCKNNPESIESGLFYTESGKSATCFEILKSPQLEKYKN